MALFPFSEDTSMNICLPRQRVPGLQQHRPCIGVLAGKGLEVLCEELSRVLLGDARGLEGPPASTPPRALSVVPPNPPLERFFSMMCVSLMQTTRPAPPNFLLQRLDPWTPQRACASCHRHQRPPFPTRASEQRDKTSPSWSLGASSASTRHAKSFCKSNGSLSNCEAFFPADACCGTRNRGGLFQAERGPKPSCNEYTCWAQQADQQHSKTQQLQCWSALLVTADLQTAWWKTIAEELEAVFALSSLSAEPNLKKNGTPFVLSKPYLPLSPREREKEKQNTSIPLHHHVHKVARDWWEKKMHKFFPLQE